MSADQDNSRLKWHVAAAIAADPRSAPKDRAEARRLCHGWMDVWLEEDPCPSPSPST